MSIDDHQISQALDRLKTTALNEASETVDDIFECRQESGLAKLIFCALTVVAKIGQHEHERVTFIGDNKVPPHTLEASTSLYVSPASTIDGHLDFAIWAYDHTGRTLGKEGWRRAVVEIDFAGEIPEISAGFLGYGRRGKDVQILRFTGEEIATDPWLAATKIFDWASRSFGY